MTTITLLLIVVAFVYACLQGMLAYRKYGMIKKDKEFRKSGSGPYGSGLCHGMVLNPDESGVIRDQKESPAWYSRLI